MPVYTYVLVLTIGLTAILTTDVRCSDSPTVLDDKNKTGYSEEETGHHNGSFPPEEHKSEHGGHSVHLAKWNYDYVMAPLLITLYALFVGIAKVGKVVFVKTIICYSMPARLTCAFKVIY